MRYIGLYIDRGTIFEIRDLDSSLKVIITNLALSLVASLRRPSEDFGLLFGEAASTHVIRYQASAS